MCGAGKDTVAAVRPKNDVAENATSTRIGKDGKSYPSTADRVQAHMAEHSDIGEVPPVAPVTVPDGEMPSGREMMDKLPLRLPAHPGGITAALHGCDDF